MNDAPSSAVADTFSAHYAEARAKFLRAARAAGGAVTSYRHPAATGPDGESVYIDVARVGPDDASRVLVVGSGTHGVEGFCGSAAQTGWLLCGSARQLPRDTAIVFTHAHNPWGFAHRDRVNENNVDLNRNFVDHAVRYPTNKGYEALHAVVTPATWDEEAVEAVFAGLDAFREAHGEQAFSNAFNGGQYTHPDGIFYGGNQPEWSNGTLRAALRDQAGRARHAAFVDLHTGIGPYLDHVFLCFHPVGSAGYDRARRWWGERAVNRAGLTHKALAHYKGLLMDIFAAMLPETETTSITVEFGTRPRPRMQRAIMSGRWLRYHGAADPVRAGEVKKAFVEAFYPSEPEWRAAVLEQSRVIVDRGIAGIASA